MEKLVSYAARAPKIAIHPGGAELFSATLADHFRRDVWNEGTWAMVERERHWLREQGLPIPGNEPIGNYDEDQLPPAARAERPPWEL